MASYKYLQSETQTWMNLLGTETAWGWSPSYSILKLIGARHQDERGARKDHHILMLGTGDVRHCMQLFAELRRSRNEKPSQTEVAPAGSTFHIYMYEANLRTHARTLFFLFYLQHCLMGRDSAADNQTVQTFPCTMCIDQLEESTQVFLEIYGNIFIRDETIRPLYSVCLQVLQYLEQEGMNDEDEAMGPTSRQAVCEPLARTLRVCDYLKNRERDFLEEQIRQWCRALKLRLDQERRTVSKKDPGPQDGIGTLPSESSSCQQVAAQWNVRIRSDLAERYDVKENILDYDFHMRLRDYSPMVRWPEYKAWRLTGIAYDYARINPRRNQCYRYTQPNPTLLTYPRTHRSGEPVYKGDILISPYIALAAHTPNPHLKKYGYDGVLKHGGGVIALNNVRQWIYEMWTGLTWGSPFEDHQLAWDDDEKYNPIPESWRTAAQDVKQKACNPFEWMYPSSQGNQNDQDARPAQQGDEDKVVITLLGLEGLTRLLKRNPNLKFDHIYTSLGLSSLVTAPDSRKEGELLDLQHIYPGETTLVVETAKYIVNIDEDGKNTFVENVRHALKANGFDFEPKMTGMLHQGVSPDPPGKKEDSQASPADVNTRRRMQMPALLAFRSAAY